MLNTQRKRVKYLVDRVKYSNFALEISYTFAKIQNNN